MVTHDQIYIWWEHADLFLWLLAWLLSFHLCLIVCLLKVIQIGLRLLCQQNFENNTEVNIFEIIPELLDTRKHNFGHDVSNTVQLDSNDLVHASDSCS